MYVVPSCRRRIFYRKLNYQVFVRGMSFRGYQDVQNIFPFIIFFCVKSWEATRYPIKLEVETCVLLDRGKFL